MCFAIRIRISSRKSKSPQTLPLEVQSILSETNKSSDCELFRSDVKKFLDNLFNFFKCRGKMDEMYRMLDPNRTLETFNLETDSNGIEIENKTHPRFKTEYQQRSIDGNPPETMSKLYEAARIAEPIFKERIIRIVDAANEALPGIQEDAVEAKFTRTLKGMKRAQEKADDDYSRRVPGPSISWLYDIVRGSILCSEADALLKVLELIQKDPSIHIVKAKNRFRNPTLSGYRDFNLCIQIDTKHGFKHICEIQIHLDSLKNLAERLNSHKFYEYFRTYFSGATTTLKERLDDLEIITKGETLNEGNVRALLKTIKDEERLERLASLFGEHLHESSWALKIYLRILEIQLSKHGREHANVSATCHAIGNILLNQGKFVGSLSMLRLSLDIQKMIGRGEDNPFVIETYNGVANVMQRRGEYDEAMDIYLNLLECYKKTIGEKNISAASIYNNMGIVLDAQDKPNEAMEKYRKALEIYENEYGDNHSSVAILCNNIGLILKIQGELDEAMITFERSVEIACRVEGKDTLTVAETYNNMGMVLTSVGMKLNSEEKEEKYKEALKMYGRCLKIVRNVYGDDYELISRSYTNIANVLHLQGKLKKCVKLNRRALIIKKKIFEGDRHPSVGDSYLAIGLSLLDQGESEGMYDIEKCAAIYRNFYPSDHRKVVRINTLISRLRQTRGGA